MRLLLILVLALSVTGCMFGRYSPPQLVTGVKPDPEQDFARLRSQFKTMGGELVCPDDDLVTWKDTSMFRIFELKHHTVAIFPYNWNSANYDIIIFAGRIKPDQNPYEALLFDSVEGPDAHVWNTRIEWNVSDPGINQIHFGDLHLGDSEQDVIARQTAYIQHSIADTQDRRNDIALLTVCKGWMDAQRSNLRLGLACIDGKLAYIETNPVGKARLSGFAIQHPNTPVVAQGTFTLAK